MATLSLEGQVKTTAELEGATKALSKQVIELTEKIKTLEEWRWTVMTQLDDLTRNTLELDPAKPNSFGYVNSSIGRLLISLTGAEPLP